MAAKHPEAEQWIARALERDRAAFEKCQAWSHRWREGWRKRRWPLVVLLAAFYLGVVSPLCLGPAVYLDQRGMFPAVKWTLVFTAWPSALLLSAAGLEDELDAYVGWWSALAREHDGRQVPVALPGPGVPPGP